MSYPVTFITSERVVGRLGYILPPPAIAGTVGVRVMIIAKYGRLLNTWQQDVRSVTIYFISVRADIPDSLSRIY